MHVQDPIYAALFAAVVSAQCTTNTDTILAIDGSIENVDQWQTSMDAAYSTPTVVETVFVATSVYTFEDENGESSFTGYVVYDRSALEAEGHTVITTVLTEIFCEPTEVTTESLPPSPTGSDCSPHGDHWHCEPLATATVTDDAGECEPHGDHWHCPDGVPEPTYAPTEAPEATTTTDAETGECEPHGDHWHCPDGVPEPTYLPTASEEPTTMVTSTESAECEPHGDHWHCPDGVPEPTFPPSAPNVTESTTPPPIPTGAGSMLQGNQGLAVLMLAMSAFFGFM